MTNEGKGDTTPLEDIRRSLRRLVIATVALYLALGALGLKTFFDGRTVTDSLCALRQDAARESLTAIQFVKSHPKGAPGIPNEVILESAANKQRTIIALKDLDCPNVDSAVLPTPTP